MNKPLSFLHKFAVRLVKNWPLKLLSLFLAVCLWAGLITQDNSLTRERSFGDVQISVNGADTLLHNSGLIVLSGLEDENLMVRLRVNVPQNQYNNVTSANYNPRVDLTKITDTGEQSLKIQTTSSATYGTVSYLMPDTITVVVDEYVSNYRVPVTIKSEGSLKDGWYGTNPVSDPSTVTVSGPATVVDRIARVCVDYSLSALNERSGRIRIALPFTFEDSNGNPVESNLLEVSSESVVLRSITVSQTLYPQKEISVCTDGLLSGSPEEGYQITSVSISPENVFVAADQSSLDSIEMISVENSLSIEGKNETFTASLKLKKTSDIVSLSSDNVMVNVQIEPVISSRSFSGLKPQVYGLADNFRCSLSVKSLSLVLTGPMPRLNQLRASSITAYINADGLSEGTYTLPVLLMIDGSDLSGFTYVTQPGTVDITITPKT